MDILLVGDNENYRRVIKDVLFCNGYSVTTATNNAEACEILDDYEPDLIIADIKMPLLDGIKLHAYARAMEKNKHVKFIFLSSYDEMSDCLLKLDPARDFIFDKTTPVKEIVSKINDLLFGKFIGKNVA